uniref:Uncharacterized protein n=1 Tax=Anguilla anguilla TaxID=7936 RepID=A0A0E9UT91_ANGAN
MPFDCGKGSYRNLSHWNELAISTEVKQ